MTQIIDRMSYDQFIEAMKQVLYANGHTSYDLSPDAITAMATDVADWLKERRLIDITRGGQVITHTS